MNKVLVTGANGFVGSALCAGLSARAIDVVPAVRRASDRRQRSTGDMSSETAWAGHLSGCDTVIHLAARVHVMDDKSGNALSAFRATNVDATLNLARQAALHGVRRFVFVSSIKVNGEATTSQPFTAFDAPAPSDPYGVSKMEAEQALRTLSDATGLEVVIVRPPLVYGPGVRANFLRLMQLVSTGIPLPLGAIHNRRSLVALDNLVDLLIVCAGQPAASGQTFLVSDLHDVSIAELLVMLAEAMGRRSRLLPVPAWMVASAAGMLGQSKAASRLLHSLQLDILHTTSTLGWRPVVGMQDAVKRTVAHFIVRH